MPNDRTESEYRAQGWMTVGEFMSMFTYGLSDHLKNKVYGLGQGERLHHPTDLAVHTAAYAEIAYSVIENFGVAICEPLEN